MWAAEDISFSLITGRRTLVEETVPCPLSSTSGRKRRGGKGEVEGTPIERGRHCKREWGGLGSTGGRVAHEGLLE